MFKKKYLIEVVMFLGYALFAMSWKAGDILIKGHGFDAAQLAAMTNAISIAKIVGSLTAATIIFKFGKKKLFLFSIFLIVSGGALALMSSYTQIFAMRFILGLGGAWVLVTINPIVSELFEGKELVVVNGLNAVAFNAGIAATLTMYKSIAAAPVKTLYIISGILILCAVMWAVLGTPDTPKSLEKKAIQSYTMFDGMKESFNWVFALAYSGLLGFYLVSFTFMEPANVKYVIYAGMVGAIAGTSIGTKFEDKLNLVRVSAFAQLVSAIAFLALYELPVAKFIGMILGFMIFFPMASYVTLAYKRKNITTEKISITFSIFWAVAYAASIVIVQTFGVLSVTTGGNTVPFMFIIAVEASFFLGTMFFMKKEQFELEVKNA